MNEPSHEPTDDECLLNDLADQFTQRLRQGESPSVEEYARQYPDLAHEIREVFSTLMLMESSQTSMSRTRWGRHPSWQLQRDRLGDYRILREVGRGGMGVVYEAIQEALGRRVALKVLPKSILADSQQLERFRREARATANLHHTNIVPVFDVGEADGVHYYAMQFIDGLPLSSLLDETTRAPSAFAWSVERWKVAELAGIAAMDERTNQVCHAKLMAEDADTAGRAETRPRLVAPSSAIHSGSRAANYIHVARLGKQVADALSYAHAEGMLHRDIKPANLLLDSHGTVWVTDFGLVRVEGQDELTSPGDVVGTLRYLPPERFEGHVDQRGDIYSLGITLYEILTLQPAFAASTRARLIDQILNAAPTPPRGIDPHIPRDLETIVLKAMSREPTQRYPRARALADDLDRFITGRPISARRLSAWGHTWRWCRRNKALAAMTALAAMLLVAVFVILLVDSVRIRNQLQQTKTARREATERLFDSLVSQAHARWMARAPYGRRFETLDVVREAAALARQMQLPEDAFARLRNEAIAALCLPDEQVAQSIDAFPPGTAQVSFDPLLQTYARGNIDGNVTIHRVADNRVLHRLPGSRPDSKLAIWDGVVFSPDGTYLQQRLGSDLRLWKVSGNTPQLAFEISEHIAQLTEFVPDGQHLGVVIHHYSPTDTGRANPTIQAHILDLASGRDVAQPVAADDTSRLVFHPTATRLAINDATAVRIVQWVTGAELSRWDRADTQPLAWSPDGRQLLARSIDEGDPRIYRWDVERQSELPALTDGEAVRHPDCIVFNHRGDRFVSGSRFRLQVWEFPADRLLWDSASTLLPEITLSPDDHLLAGFSGGILELADGRELRRVPLSSSPLGEEIHRAVMTREGRILAAPSAAGTHLVDLQTHEVLAVIPGQRMPLVFEPDGSLLTHANAPEGVARWPISMDVHREITVGSPQSLTDVRDEALPEPSLFVGLGHWTASADGRVIATPWQQNRTGAGANIYVADSGDRAKYRCVELGRQHDVRFTSVSPDGKYVATGSVSFLAQREEATDSVTVWDSTTGRRIIDLLVGEGWPQFSRDGQWIAVAGHAVSGVRLWRVGSWKPAPAPPDGSGGSVAFDAESRLMAVSGNPIRLLVPETGREVAKWAHPDQGDITTTCFTPDGTRLIGMGMHNDQWYVWIWDLRLIRHQLAELGLDWDARP